MTLGQHIQSLRKKAGLSQEALGEALGVSRQAVSKWEADAAVPELDTLIAMSRLFGISLGQLLQIEEPMDVDAPSANESFSAEQMEAILHQYARQAQSGKEKHRIYTWVIGGLTAVLFLCGGIYIVQKFNSLQQNIYYLEGQISNLRSSVNSEINNITYRISEALEEQDNILADYSIIPVKVDISNGTVLYRLSASLKEVQEGSTARFLLNYQTTSGKIGTAETGLLQGPVFEGTVALPFNHHTDITLQVTDPNGTQRTQKVDVIYDAHEDYYRITGEAYTGYSMRSISNDELDFTIDGTYQLFYPSVAKALEFDLSLEEIKVALYYNDQLLDSAEMIPVNIRGCDNDSSTEAAIEIAPPDTAVSIVATGENQIYGLKEPFNFRRKVNEGDIIKMIFSITDNYGRTTYETGGRDKAIEIIKDNNRFSIRHVELTEDMLP
ncbi:MAG: helix-turn-helix domain-containing protein [Clostridia bacterium]|nr:helix-turn-helix domain-containing protein [Clostridia bacterium]